MNKKLLLPVVILFVYSFDCRVEVPPAFQDHAPAITITVADRARNTSNAYKTDAQVNVPLGTQLTFISSAYNGGGVKNHVLSISSPQQTYLRTSSPDSKNKVPKQINIAFQDDDKTLIQVNFNTPGQTVIVTGTSENYNFMQTKVTLSFMTAFPPPKIDYLKFTVRNPPFGHGEEDGYIKRGQSTDILWKVLNCSSGCNITLTALDQAGWTHTVFTATGLPAQGSRTVTPAEVWTRYVLTVSNVWGSDKKEVDQQLDVNP